MNTPHAQKHVLLKAKVNHANASLYKSIVGSLQ